MEFIRKLAIANLFGACLFALPFIVVAVVDQSSKGTLEYKSQSPALLNWDATTMAKTNDIATLRHQAEGLVKTYNVLLQSGAAYRQYGTVLLDMLILIGATAGMALLANSILLFWLLRKKLNPSQV